MTREKLPIALARLYFLFLFGWLILHFLFDDRWAWLFLLNTLAEFLFLPLVLTILITWKFRVRDLALGSAIAFLAAIIMFGGLFTPKFPPMPNAPALRVMTYNMLGYTDNPNAVVASIRQNSADVIAIQELNPGAADAIQRDLLREYPHQILDPHDGVSGLGVISRFPIRTLSNVTLAGQWIGTPQILQLDWQGARIVFLHIHTVPTTSLSPQGIESSLRSREESLRELSAYIATYSNTPIIATGDFNMTEQTASYRIVTSALRDSWREIGWGLGHTFPSTNLNGMTLPSIADASPLMWLVRIDYIFHSSQWRAVSAKTGNWDGQSDHRPVIVELALRKK